MYFFVTLKHLKEVTVIAMTCQISVTNGYKTKDNLVSPVVSRKQKLLLKMFVRTNSCYFLFIFHFYVYVPSGVVDIISKIPRTQYCLKI